MSETPISSPPGMHITEQNKLKGSLFIEAYGSLIDSIGKEAETETEKALDITFNAIGAASATAMLVVDPLGSLIGAGVGWLIEHVSFLRDALNQVMGDPDEIEANVQATKARAAELRALAEEHRNGLATFDGWTGQSSEQFKKSMDSMYQELDDLANAVETKAKIVAIMGMLVTVLRDIVRDLIAQLLGSLIAGALIAAAFAIPTFGASIAAFAGFATGKAIALGVNISARVARVVNALQRQMKRIGDLDDIMAKISKGWERFENVADVAEIAYEGYKAANGVDKKINETVANNQPATNFEARSQPVRTFEAPAPMTTTLQAVAPMPDTGGTAFRPALNEKTIPNAVTDDQMTVPATPAHAVRRMTEPTPDLATRQMTEPTPDLATRQMTEPTPDLATRQMTEPTPDLATRQMTEPAERHLLNRLSDVQPHATQASSDATVASGVSSTAGTPVHHAVEPLLPFSTQAEPLQQVTPFETLARTQMSHAYEVLEPSRPPEPYSSVQGAQAYEPLQAYPTLDVTPAEEGYNPLLHTETIQPAAAVEAPSEPSGTPVQPTVLHDRSNRLPE